MNEYNLDASAVKPLYYISQIIWYAFYIIEIILFFRFILELFGANPDAAFTQFVYAISFPLVSPFLYVFPSTQISGEIIEWATPLALVVYWIIAVALTKLLVMTKPVSHTEAHQKLDEQGEEL